MSKIVKFFSKKSSGNKENHNDSLKRVNFERASTRSEAGMSSAGSELQRERERQSMRAIANPYSVWTEPKKTRGPSSCPGVALDSSSSGYYGERRSVRQPKQQRAGSVYGDMGSMRQYRIDGDSSMQRGGSGRASSEYGCSSSRQLQQLQLQQARHSQQQHRSSRRYGDLSMIEERSERSDRSGNQSMREYAEWANRSSHGGRAHSVLDYTSGDSEEEEDAYVRRLEEKCAKLYEDKRRYRDKLDQKKSDLEYYEYQLKQALEKVTELENQNHQFARTMEKLKVQLEMEREKTNELELRISSMSSSTSNGAMERLVSSSETSLEMGEEEEEGGERGGEGDEVRNFRGCSDSLMPAAGPAAAGSAADAGAAALPQLLSRTMRVTPADENVEYPRGSLVANSPLFELRRSASDMGPMSYSIEGAAEEMAVQEGGSWRRQREKRRSFIKRPMLACHQESESSDGEKILLTERQLRKKGAVVKYDPNRRISVKEKHYRRFGKPERSALDRFTFLEQEVTDISGMLSSPNEGNY